MVCGLNHTKIEVILLKAQWWNDTAAKWQKKDPHHTKV